MQPSGQQYAQPRNRGVLPAAPDDDGYRAFGPSYTHNRELPAIVLNAPLYSSRRLIRIAGNAFPPFFAETGAVPMPARSAETGQ